MILLCVIHDLILWFALQLFQIHFAAKNSHFWARQTFRRLIKFPVEIFVEQDFVQWDVLTGPGFDWLERSFIW